MASKDAVSTADAKAERLSATKKVMSDPASTPEQRRQAAIERASLLGVEPPPALLEQSEPKFKVDIAIPDSPPTADVVEDGVYVLSTSMTFENGPRIDNRQVCKVTVRGEEIALRFDRGGANPVAASLKEGRFSAEVKEGDGQISLTGQVAGPGKLAGRANGKAPGGLAIKDGRWLLERVK